VSDSQLLIAPRRRGSQTGRAAILTVVAAILVATLAVPVRAWFNQRDEIASLEADVAAARSLTENLRIEKERWADPAFIAAQARSRLHFVKPGEIGYTTIGTEDLPEELAPAPVVEAAPQLWFERLWSATSEADAGLAPKSEQAAGTSEIDAAADDKQGE
jgi:cell division protein FtsB